MLWLPASDQDFAASVKMGAKHYLKKYGRPPTHCHVRQPPEGVRMIDGITVVVDSTITPHHVLFTEEKYAKEV